MKKEVHIWHEPETDTLIELHFGVGEVIGSTLFGNPPPFVKKMNLKMSPENPNGEGSWMKSKNGQYLFYVGEL